MKKRMGYILAVVFALPIMAGAATISGEVDGGMGGVATSNFVSGATVTLINGSGAQAVVIGSTTTNGSGQYSFSSVPTGFTQVSVSASGYTPNPSTTVLAINSDTATATVNFFLSNGGSQVIAGNSTVGGQVNGTSGILNGIQVTLRRRATTTGAWTIVDSTLTDSLGSFSFAGIAAAGTSYDINAYSFIINVGGYNSFTSAAITVADGAVSATTVTLTPTALISGTSNPFHGILFSRLGAQLALDLGFSKEVRTLEIYRLNGIVQQRISVPAGISRLMLSASFAPEKGFLFRVK